MPISLAASQRADQNPDQVDSLPASIATKGPATAPVIIIEFSDFECPFCARVAPTVEESLRAFPKQIQFIFKQNPLAMHPHSPMAHEAALAAGAQGKFWEMHDLLFANQSHLEPDDLVRYARQLNLDLTAFRNALDSHIAEARGLGVTSTPTFFINGNKLLGAQSLEGMKAAINQALGLTKTANQPTLTAPLSGSVEKVDVGSSPFRGGADSPVTIVEFADFQCPFCSRAIPTLQRLLKEYPERVKWVFKNYPLDFHPDSLLAHQAALAAGEQGKFWEMHDSIYADQKAIKRDDLIQKAKQLGLDMNRFITDVASDRFRAVLEDDKAQATRLGVTGTPTYFVNGKKMVGAWPLAEYKKLVEAELKPGGAKPSTFIANGNEPFDSEDPQKKGNDPSKQETKKEEGYVSVTKGPQGAPTTIIWYSDLESSLGPRSAQLIEQVMNAYPDKVRLIFKNRPLEFHTEAPLVHEAALAAAQQGKFWEMQNLILTHQRALMKEDLIAYAAQLGLDMRKFEAELDAHTYRPTVENDLAEARRQQIRGTPVFLVNGQRIDGIQPLSAFQEIIDGVLKGAPLINSSR